MTTTRATPARHSARPHRRVRPQNRRLQEEGEPASGRFPAGPPAVVELAPLSPSLVAHLTDGRSVRRYGQVWQDPGARPLPVRRGRIRRPRTRSRLGSAARPAVLARLPAPRRLGSLARQAALKGCPRPARGLSPRLRSVGESGVAVLLRPGFQASASVRSLCPGAGRRLKVVFPIAGEPRACCSSQGVGGQQSCVAAQQAPPRPAAAAGPPSGLRHRPHPLRAAVRRRRLDRPLRPQRRGPGPHQRGGRGTAGACPGEAPIHQARILRSPPPVCRRRSPRAGRGLRRRSRGGAERRIAVLNAHGDLTGDGAAAAAADPIGVRGSADPLAGGGRVPPVTPSGSGQPGTRPLTPTHARRMYGKSKRFVRYLR